MSAHGHGGVPPGRRPAQGFVYKRVPHVTLKSIANNPDIREGMTREEKEAAKEAIKGLGFDLLLVAGLAFDAHVGEEVKHLGKLTVLPVKMHPDVAMGDELLKKTGAGNLFMVFGEPDIVIERAGIESVEFCKRGAA